MTWKKTPSIDDRWELIKLKLHKNDLWAPDEDRTRNMLMTGETRNHWTTETQMASEGASSTYVLLIRQPHFNLTNVQWSSMNISKAQHSKH